MKEHGICQSVSESNIINQAGRLADKKDSKNLPKAYSHRFLFNFRTLFLMRKVKLLQNGKPIQKDTIVRVTSLVCCYLL